MKLKRRIIIIFSFLIVFSALGFTSNYFKNQPQKNIENVFNSGNLFNGIFFSKAAITNDAAKWINISLAWTKGKGEIKRKIISKYNISQKAIERCNVYAQKFHFWNTIRTFSILFALISLIIMGAIFINLQWDKVSTKLSLQWVKKRKKVIGKCLFFSIFISAVYRCLISPPIYYNGAIKTAKLSFELIGLTILGGIIYWIFLRKSEEK